MTLGVIAAPSIWPNDPKHVTAQEIKNALKNNVQTAIEQIQPKAKLNVDYDFTVSRDDHGAIIDTLDFTSSIAANRTVYVIVRSLDDSGYLKNVSNAKDVVFTQDTRSDISTVDTIAAPLTVPAEDGNAVTEAEVRAALNPKVVDAVNALDPTPNVSINDLTYAIYTDEQAETILPDTIDLVGDAYPVWIIITAESNNQKIWGKTQTPINVILPKIV
ncbi:hypothetical protein [Spiroplasma chrysopicola]|nr:hypothetical protein [Spiroplasma chrysopicola]